MIKAEYDNKNLIVDILTRSFDTNQSVDYIVQHGKKRQDRIKALMDYSFDICYSFGRVFLSNDKRACALILFPDQKRTTLRSIWLDVKLILSCIGVVNIKKVVTRELRIKNLQPKEPMYYLWFIGVDPEYQNTGIGSRLLYEVIEDSKLKRRSVYLETSTLKNLPWYKKFSFVIYNELDLGYNLFFLKRELTTE